MALMQIDDGGAAAPAPYRGPAWLALGFRPFYLVAAVFAAFSIPLWLASYGGYLSLATVGVAWHMHEMRYGFVLAVVIGFLYTAGRNWTGLWTPRGGLLAAIVLLWLAGRVAMLAPVSAVAAAVDLLFVPVATWPLYRVIARSNNARNRILVVVLSLLALANGLFHAAQLGLLELAPSRPMYAALIMIVVIESIIGGRVIPNFTANAVPGSTPVQNATLDKAAMLLTVLAGAAWALELTPLVAAPLALGAALVQARRLLLWQPHLTLHQPLLWILHLSYAAIPAGFALLALSHLGLATASAVVHLLGVGAIAGLIVGMITRTALGHTGRLLKAGRAETAMYAAIQLGMLARLAAAFCTGPWRAALLLASGALWSFTFLLYLAVYAPRLWTARIDGREG